MAINKNVRNVLIIVVAAALIVLIPGGGRGARVAIQAISLAFLGALAWVASLMYRQHRLDLEGLGTRRRAILYISVGVGVVTLTATHRMWNLGGGVQVAWLALMAGAVYGVVAVYLSARRY